MKSEESACAQAKAAYDEYDDYDATYDNCNLDGRIECQWVVLYL